VLALTERHVPSSAVITGLIAGIITAGLVSRATPDGNLVVTGVPALVVGLAAYGIARWMQRRGGAG
jgi:hypothetical protein